MGGNLCPLLRDRKVNKIRKSLKLAFDTDSDPRIPFMSDMEAASSPYNLLVFILAAFWVPLYREFHFYFAHRFEVLNDEFLL